MNNKLKKEYKIQFSELRSLINSWNLIPSSPADEFDSLNHMCLSMLYKGADKNKITKSIHHELTANFGFSIEKEDSAKLAREITLWWMENN
ncbi:hypothetical protein [Maribacter arenosus]|uniref:Uncharacterized protein n=1 Tax=Maribacter arenosus TaxID=1854708 RepID=A0ABR7VF07_9FLAO|nr:hypothetical protein [Maribacter arenosus]MBD0851958.1 hypothetical protein [Maribacter arenosus]